MQLRPLNDNLIIDRDEEEFVAEDPKVNEALKKGTIILPENVEGFLKKAPMTGKIISWGSRCLYQHKIGERIIFGRFSGVKFKWQEKDYYIINEKDLLAKEEN